jgi:hypothetical protein
MIVVHQMEQSPFLAGVLAPRACRLARRYRDFSVLWLVRLRGYPYCAGLAVVVRLTGGPPTPKPNLFGRIHKSLRV